MEHVVSVPTSASVRLPITADLTTGDKSADDPPEPPSIRLNAALGSAAAALLLIPIHEVGAALFALRAFQGVALALVFSAAATLASDIAPPARLGQALGLFGCASLVTNAIAPALCEVIASRTG